MAAYRRVYDSRHLQADCQEPGSAAEPYALGNRVRATITFFVVNTAERLFTSRLAYHGLRGSASPVLTATGFVNGRWQFSTPHRINTP